MGSPKRGVEGQGAAVVKVGGPLDTTASVLTGHLEDRLREQLADATVPARRVLEISTGRCIQFLRGEVAVG